MTGLRGPSLDFRARLFAIWGDRVVEGPPDHPPAPPVFPG